MACFLKPKSPYNLTNTAWPQEGVVDAADESERMMDTDKKGRANE